MNKKKRAEKLMAKGPIKNVRRIIELEDALEQAYITIGKIATGEVDLKELGINDLLYSPGGKHGNRSVS